VVSVVVENPLLRTPLSLIIDDSCPVINKAYYWIRQRDAWRRRHGITAPPSGWEKHVDKLGQMPQTIPADFAREWGEWCAEEGIRGKFSLIPYPAGVARVDQGFPGFPRDEFDAWMRAVEEVIHPNFDITAEMLTHTHVVDLDTWTLTEEWEQGEWVDPPLDRLPRYVRTAMELLKNAGITCDGVTSPGAFGKRQESAYAKATLDAAVELFGNRRPFYFLHLIHEGLPDVPLWHVDRESGTAIGSIVACAGDWFGATGYDTANPDLFITEDLRGGRLPEVLAAERPCVLVGHWPCFYANGRIGFRVLREVKRRLDAFDPERSKTLWMKNSEIARYAMARELTDLETKTSDEGGVTVARTRFPTPNFTLRWEGVARRVRVNGVELRRVDSRRALAMGTYLVEGKTTVAAFDLQEGETQVTWSL